MTLAQFSVGALVLLPLLSAAVLAVLPHLARRIAGVVLGVAMLALTVPLVVTVASGEVIEVPLGNYGAPLGIMLRADGMSAIFLALTAVVGLCVSIFAALVPEAQQHHGNQCDRVTVWVLAECLGCLVHIQGARD